MPDSVIGGRCRLEPIETEEDYIQALRRHDWFYVYSDDHRYWDDGRKSFELIDAAQPHYDKNWILWNHYAPNDWKVKCEAN